MPSQQDPCSAEIGGSELDDQAIPTGTPPAADTLLSSHALLGGRNAVKIEHQGVQYVLRATRSGKLILTK